MRTTKEGFDLIKSFEGCALTAYQDQEGIWTIGWGHTRNVAAGQTCDETAATGWLYDDISIAEYELGLLLPLDTLTDNQVSALVSFYYNVGPGEENVKDGFRVLKDGSPSTMLKCLRARNFLCAAEEFPKWANAGGHPSAGLMRRRLAEQALFMASPGPEVPDVGSA